MEQTQIVSICPHTLQEVCCPPSHTAVDVRFAGLDVVVEVVSECLDVRDDFFSTLRCKMAWEENYSRMLVLLAFLL